MNNKHNIKVYLVIISIIIIYTINMIGVDVVPIEEVDVINGVSYDIQKLSPTSIKYVFPFSFSIFYLNGKRGNKVNVGEGLTVGDSIQNRQRVMNKKFVQGLEKIFVISDKYASNGIRTILDERARSNEASDMAFGMVCKGNSEDILKAKIKGYSSSSDYLQGLIDKAQQENFFSQNYKIIDIFVRTDSEGRNVVLPYIGIGEDTIEITGLAVFKKDKMVCKTDVDDAKLLNMLRENNVEGTLSLERNSKEYIDIHVNSKRKVKCEKTGDKYRFTISLDMTGEIITNELYKDIKDSQQEKKQFENEISKKTEEKCRAFINKMQNEYKVDCLELGKKAASKYGRRKGIDWNEVICNSNIEVKVKVKVSRQGKGDY